MTINQITMYTFYALIELNDKLSLFIFILVQKRNEIWDLACLVNSSLFSICFSFSSTFWWPSKRNENILLCFNAQNMTPKFLKKRKFRFDKKGENSKSFWNIVGIVWLMTFIFIFLKKKNKFEKKNLYS